MNPCTFFKCLADDTRLKSLLLIAKTEEACVCDLMEALQLDQPKTSRHLAQLRKCGILLDERRGKWVFYKLHPELPQWAQDVIINAAEHNDDYFSAALHQLIASQSSSISCC
ncbi:MAG: ArsR family transcriptional regulator [Bermanella sp.]|jgi:ArsR family transcriptional regulator|uniref:metalloregulator ArsR/SmtB family transcription factor n=1 Tax=Glaciecola sp. 33A TaxID=2057807 RepID=UPI000C3245F8|nr:metalloregulator ArsR/SmtB family transcription factor [Glaciecola sp. 33A]PKH99894.1 transcriptional regulator [Glaciecola sp. 33A]